VETRDEAGTRGIDDDDRPPARLPLQVFNQPAIRGQVPDSRNKAGQIHRQTPQLMAEMPISSVSFYNRC